MKGENWAESLIMQQKMSVTFGGPAGTLRDTEGLLKTNFIRRILPFMVLLGTTTIKYCSVGKLYRPTKTVSLCTNARASVSGGLVLLCWDIFTTNWVNYRGSRCTDLLIISCVVRLFGKFVLLCHMKYITYMYHSALDSAIDILIHNIRTKWHPIVIVSLVLYQYSIKPSLDYQYHTNIWVTLTWRRCALWTFKQWSLKCVYITEFLFTC